MLKVPRHNYNRNTKTKVEHNNNTAARAMILIARYVTRILNLRVFIIYFVRS